MAEYTGSRRTSEPLAAAPLSAGHPPDPFAEDDDMPTCPRCGAGVRPGQEWCTLCLHVLREPEPEPAPTPEPEPASTAGSTLDRTPVHTPVVTAGLAPGLIGQVATAPAVLPEEVEAAAEALLAQLAVESRRERLTVPSFLDSNLKVGVAVTVGIAAFCIVVLVGLTIAGAVLR